MMLERKCPYCDAYNNIEFIDCDSNSIKYICRNCGNDFIIHADGEYTTRNNAPIKPLNKYSKFYLKTMNFLTEQTSLTDLSCDENLLVLIAMYELEDSDIDDIESAVNDCIHVYQTTPDSISFSKLCYAYDLWYRNREEDTREFEHTWHIYYFMLEE